MYLYIKFHTIFDNNVGILAVNAFYVWHYSRHLQTDQYKYLPLLVVEEYLSQINQDGGCDGNLVCPN